jgi:hypothetical protein
MNGTIPFGEERYDHLLVERHAAVAVNSLNRIEAKNALN